MRLRKDWHERQQSKSSKPSSKSRRDSGSTKETKSDREREEKQKESGGDSKSPKDISTSQADQPAVITDLSSSETTPHTDFNDLSTLSEEEIAAIKDRVISARRKVHKVTVGAVTARWSFEEGIKRPYFHVKPLERAQLKNWKDYLDFEIEKGDRERILVLFERCLIACALYDEFWLKMLRYLESLGDQSTQVLNITREVYRRACRIHHPDKPSLHLMWAAFEECQLNFDSAAEILERIEQRCPNLLQIAYRRINVERRRGALEKCQELYKHYIENSKNKAIAGSLSIKYARFLNKICNDLDAGLAALQQALERDPANTRVALQMIDLCLQRPTVVEDEVVQIMDKFMERADIEPDQKVLFAQRKVEFLEDFGSSAKGLQDAQRALQQALGKATEAQKKRYVNFKSQAKLILQCQLSLLYSAATAVLHARHQQLTKRVLLLLVDHQQLQQHTTMEARQRRMQTTTTIQPTRVATMLNRVAVPIRNNSSPMIPTITNGEDMVLVTPAAQEGTTTTASGADTIITIRPMNKSIRFSYFHKASTSTV